ncbi:2-dehydro-3-deoxy-phosphogluconate aldolase [Echinicola pacifica]|uniref:2-dehydro-3-deoxy-phosphogluconate aldolase n=1 Tax=Echinicola pacifica TaxID=346377 RepID=A0A918UX64_9BACT|nr:bifunctional 4-hydroxy-2-oxoglutarate aldolase/2-dehydro-3-deoxy-phosphogluconate aldolase [Echinicola pacifica]GGZ40125.1 2-dehydro-3-deoxy-phosphogluconate aldolase [Echinicola pacifica]
MKNIETFSWEKFYEAPIIGIVRGMAPSLLTDITRVYSQSGLTTLEITMNSPSAAEMIHLLRQTFPDLNIGAGTVCTMEDLDIAIDSGAQFIVTPIVDKAVIQQCVALKIPVFAGAFTPTEIHLAWSAGASAVKVFPATQLGTTYIRDILAPLNQIKLLPTGGVDASNIRSFFAAGAIGVGMGSSLFDKKLIEMEDLVGLERHFRHIRSEALYNQIQ